MGDSLNSYVCRVCNISCTGPETFQQHLAGTKHLKKERQSKMYDFAPNSPKAQPTQSLFQCQDYSCKICQTVMSGPEAYIAHMAGKLHAKKLRQLELIKTISSSNESSDFSLSQEAIKITPIRETTSMPTQLEHPESFHFCSLCEVPLSGPESAHSHYVGAQHAKKLKRNQYMSKATTMQATLGLGESSSFCTLCKVPLSGSESAQAHLEGAQHQEYLKQREFLAMDGNLCNLQLNDSRPENLCKEIPLEADATEELRNTYRQAENNVVEDQEED